MSFIDYPWREGGFLQFCPPLLFTNPLLFSGKGWTDEGGVTKGAGMQDERGKQTGRDRAWCRKGERLDECHPSLHFSSFNSHYSHPVLSIPILSHLFASYPTYSYLHSSPPHLFCSSLPLHPSSFSLPNSLTSSSAIHPDLAAMQKHGKNYH